jgi:hypothetical protein
MHAPGNSQGNRLTRTRIQWNPGSCLCADGADQGASCCTRMLSKAVAPSAVA